jgi:hypothetical protein
MARNFFKRYIWLINTVLAYGETGISRREINERWLQSSENEDHDELPERTLHNHIQAIADTFGIDIECNKMRRYHIINPKAIEDNGLRQLMLKAMMNDDKSLYNSILLENVPSSEPYLSTLIEAIRCKHTVEMAYQPYYQTEPDHFEASPYCLKQFKQRWYAVVQKNGSGEPRIYAFDRIKSLQITQNTFEIPKDFDAHAFFENVYGICFQCGDAVEEVRLKVMNDQVPYFDSLPLHHTQRKVLSNSEYAVYSYRLAPNKFDFVQELLTKRDRIEVLAPESLRQAMRETIENMLKRYQ